MRNFFNDKEFNDFLNEFFNKPYFNVPNFLGEYSTDEGTNEYGDWTKKTYTSKDGGVKIVKFYQSNLEQNDELISLKRELDKSVENQDYENAVILRDKIKNLEGNKNEIQELEKELRLTIEKQEFEKSIKLRDKINKLKSK